MRITKRTRLLVALVAVIALTGALAAAPVFGGNDGGVTGVEKAIAAQEKHTDALLSIKGVVGTAVGAGSDNRAVVLVFTATPGVAGIPSELDGIKVAPRFSGEFTARHHCKGKHAEDPHCTQPPPTEEPPPDGGNLTPRDTWPRPVPIGVSSGTQRFITVGPDTFCTTGTLGARVTDGTNGYALSNAHVYALAGANSVGAVQIGDKIHQAGPADTSCQIDPTREIGTLAAYEPVKLDGSDNTIDAAIALTTVSNVDNSTPSDEYGTPRSTIAQPVINGRVQKYGRTTGLTRSGIAGINATVYVIYDTGTARFVGQIITQPGGPFVQGGDSGSLLVYAKGKNNRKPVGLVFAGSQLFSIANPIDAVVKRFNVTIDGN